MKNSKKFATKSVVDIQQWKQMKQEQRLSDQPINYVILGGSKRVDIPTCTVAEFAEMAEDFTKQHPERFGIGDFAMLLMNAYVMGVQRERAK